MWSIKFKQRQIEITTILSQDHTTIKDNNNTTQQQKQQQQRTPNKKKTPLNSTDLLNFHNFIDC